MKIKNFKGILLIASLLLASCEKFLDEKPDKKLSVPANAQDLQSLMDSYKVMNELDASWGEISAGDFILTDTDLGGLSYEGHKKMYTWEPEFYLAVPNDWSNLYRRVNYANVVLEHIKVLAPKGGEFNNVKGQALFHRAWAFFSLATVYSQVYNPATAKNDLGIVLRLNSDFNEPSVRASNQETYALILKDMQQAVALLPEKQVTVFRPSKAAAYGFLSRVYLAMNNFTEAKLYADSALARVSALLDYNTITASATYPFTKLNAEVVYENAMQIASPLQNTVAEIVPELYGQYEANDLRKTAFFRTKSAGKYAFKGSYENTNVLFNGIAVDELLLTRAESRIRNGDITGGLGDLNTLLVKRYKTGTFKPVTTNALENVLKERRKELLMRGIRWTDIKRLNLLGEQITLTRIANGSTYTLPPGSLKYALPVPEDIVALGVKQNPR